MIDPLCSMPGSAGNQYGISFSLIWEWRFGIWSTPATLRKNSTTRHIEFPTVWIAPRNTQLKTHSLLFPQMRHVHKSDFYYRRVLRFTSNAFTRTRTTTWHSASARTADNQAMNAAWPPARLQSDDQPQPPRYRKRYSCPCTIYQNVFSNAFLNPQICKQRLRE